MDLNQIYTALEKIDGKVDKIDTKLDGHAERLVKVEEQSRNNAGMIKMALTGIIAVVTSIVIFSWKQIFRGN